jgi:hypothetical protein
MTTSTGLQSSRASTTLSSEAVLRQFGLKRARVVEIPDADRHRLVEFFAEWGFTVGVEVGTEKGWFAKELLNGIPGLQLTCVDPWKAYRGYREHVTQEKLDGLYEEARARLSRYPNAKIIREFSVPAAASFDNRSLDFVYIDGNHELSHVISDLSAWRPKVREGGVVSGHDYIRRKNADYYMHVVDALNAFTYAWKIPTLFLVGTKEMIPGHRRDRPRSWFWVEE